MATTLREALRDIETLPWNHALYLPPRRAWNEDSECLVLDPDDVANSEDSAPQDAKERGLKYALNVTTVRDIAENLREQGITPDSAVLFRAFCYYYDNDAFLDVGC